MKNSEVLQNKTKAARCFCVLIQAHNDLLNLSGSGEKLIHLLFRCIKRHITNIDSDWCQKCMFKVLLWSSKSSIPICWKLWWILKIKQNRIIHKLCTPIKKQWLTSWSIQHNNIGIIPFFLINRARRGFLFYLFGGAKDVEGGVNTQYVHMQLNKPGRT